MARRKANLRTCPKSVTLQRASSQDADEVGDQAMHEASTQVSTQVSTQGMGFLVKSLPFIWVEATEYEYIYDLIWGRSFVKIP